MQNCNFQLKINFELGHIFSIYRKPVGFKHAVAFNVFFILKISVVNDGNTQTLQRMVRCR